MFLHLDANESAFFTRELTKVKSKTYDILYPELKAVKYIPVSSDAGEGAQTILYRQFDVFGMMKLISNYAADLPRADVAGKEFSVIVKDLGGSYGYNVKEIKNAQFAGRPLDSRKASAVRFAYDLAVNNYAWMADGSVNYGGLYGVLFNPNVTKGTPTTGTWGSASADQILADIAKAWAAARTLTKGVERPNTMLMPPAQFTKISSMRLGTDSDTTVLEFLKKVYPGVTIDELNELTAPVNSAGNRPSGVTGGVDCLLLMNSSADKLTLELPMLFTQLAPEQRNLEIIVNAMGSIGGVIIYYPLSVYIQEGI